MLHSFKSKLIFVFSLLCLLSSCGEKERTERVDSNLEMAKELALIAADESDITLWHLNRKRAEFIDSKIVEISVPERKVSLLFQSGTEWLNAGDYTKAIERFQQIIEYFSSLELKGLSEENELMINEMLGMAYLRKAEIENCLEHHNEQSCIFPLAESAQHINKEGAENAAKIFRQLLIDSKGNTQTKWLYNICHMALGTYPQGVEKAFLIPEDLFTSDIDFPAFKDVAMALGVAVNDISGSVIMDDFNNDQLLDLMVSSYGLRDQLRYFENRGAQGFEEQTIPAGLKGINSGLNMVQADYDNDGYVDVLVLRGAWLGKNGTHPNSLLRNNGDGTFSDVTRSAGLYSRYPTQTAAWADINNDGWIDLFIGNEHSNNINAPCQLYLNNGDGTFKDVAGEKGVDILGFTKGVVWTDYNNDSYPDLYISFVNNYNVLLENLGPDGNFAFANVTQKAGVAEPLNSFPCWSFDYDQDGLEDLFVSGFDFRQFNTAAGEVAKDILGEDVDAELPRLYRNNGDGSYTELSKEVGLDKVLFTMGCNFGDLNNDGFPDFYAATGTPDFRAIIPNKMFLNNMGKSFLDVTTAGGFGHLQKGHGVSFGDIDNDGDQDVYTVLGGSYDGDNFMNALFENPGHGENWVKFKLEGTSSNRSAIGAKVKTVLIDGEGNERIFYNTLNSGGSFGANPLLIEQGIGSLENISRVEVSWPGDQAPEIFTGIKARALYHLKQGSGEAKQIDLPLLEFKLDHKMHDHSA